MHTVSFPGLGLSFALDPVAFSIGDLEIKWYGVIITFGIVCAFLLFYRYAKFKEGLPEDHLYNLALFTIPIAIIGARFVYVATSWEQYKGDFMKIMNIRGGGLAIYGAVIFGALTVIIYSKITKLNALKLMDAVAPAVMVGQAIGRWGNFVNAEAYGYSPGVENLPWRMEITDALGNVTVAHPTFLYESLWNVVGILLIYFLFYPKKKFDGQIILLYLGWYGFGRAWIELLRTDSLYVFGGRVKFSVLVGILSVGICIVGMIVLSRRAKRMHEQATYTSKFESIKVQTIPEEETEQEECEPDRNPADTPKDTNEE